jgi:hypothetical protein
MPFAHKWSTDKWKGRVCCTTCNGSFDVDKMKWCLACYMWWCPACLEKNSEGCLKNWTVTK